MAIENPERRPAAAPLAWRMQRDADADEIAATLLAVCKEIDCALLPIIGMQGVTALHTRSAHLAAARHPWMASPRDRKALSSGVELLVALIAQREAAEALSSSDAYLKIFYDLLVSFIGPTLTLRLLRDVWPPSLSSGSPAQ